MTMCFCPGHKYPHTPGSVPTCDYATATTRNADGTLTYERRVSAHDPIAYSEAFGEHPGDIDAESRAAIERQYR